VAKLICTAITTLDGYIDGEGGEFDWSEPSAEVHGFINDLERPIGTYLYGRRLYEVMAYWETAVADADQPPVVLDYAKIWRSAGKVVYSTTLEAVSSARTRIERTFDPDAVRAMKDAAVQDLSVGGSELAGHAFRAGLVDELRMFVYPVSVGGGRSFLPQGLRLNLRLLDSRSFDSGVVYARYQVTA
jgi:dihydrofolate reductase